MKIIRSQEVAELAAAIPAETGQLAANWLEGPARADRLDVGIVTLSAGGATPPHVHLGGQVIVAISGTGFIECGDERQVVSAGDVVICPPGERHTHGASDDSSFSHLTVTTLDYQF